MLLSPYYTSLSPYYTLLHVLHSPIFVFFLSLPFSFTGVGAGGTFLAGVSEGAGLGTLAAAADAAAPPAAHLSVLGDARRRVYGAVAVVANVAGVALALSAVALAMT